LGGSKIPKGELCVKEIFTQYPELGCGIGPFAQKLINDLIYDLTDFLPYRKRVGNTRIKPTLSCGASNLVALAE